MRTNEERVGLIHKRTAEIKREQQKRKQRALDMICIAACLIFVVGIGLFMPGLAAGIPGGEVHHASSVGTYVIIGFFAFVIGVTLTVFYIRVKNKSTNRTDRVEESED